MHILRSQYVPAPSGTPRLRSPDRYPAESSLHTIPAAPNREWGRQNTPAIWYVPAAGCTSPVPPPDLIQSTFPKDFGFVPCNCPGSSSRAERLKSSHNLPLPAPQRSFAAHSRTHVLRYLPHYRSLRKSRSFQSPPHYPESAPLRKFHCEDHRCFQSLD